MKITPIQFKIEMRQIQQRHEGDDETIHGYMDDLMARTLRGLGYEEGVKIFEQQDRWYA